MMDQFERVYWPGGMSLSHSAWVLVLTYSNDYAVRVATLEVVK